MGYSGIDDLITQISANGKLLSLPFSRIVNAGATSVAGRWHEAFAVGGGTGGIGVLTGTAGQGIAFNRSSPGALPLNADVSTATRHLLNGHVFTAGATMVPGIAKLIDLLYAYPACVVTGTPTTIAQTATRPARLTNDFVGVQLGCIVAGTGIGAAQPLLTVTYADQSDSTTGTCVFVASANSQPIGSLLTNGSVAGVLGGPNGFLAAGDTGVAKVNSYAITSGGTTGTVTFFLYREIATFPIPAVGIAGERDFLTGTPTLPQIDDDACLIFLVQPGGALTANQVISGELVYGWN